MKSIDKWLAEYGESHQNETNKLIHWICVPLIFLSVTGLLYSVKFPLYLGNFQLNLAIFVMALVVVYYAALSKTLWIGLLIFALVCIAICWFVERSGLMPLWLFSVIIFILAWIGQFYGHNVEGKKPSFLKDLQFLLIGPAWLMSFIYKRMGVSI